MCCVAIKRKPAGAQRSISDMASAAVAAGGCAAVSTSWRRRVCSKTIDSGASHILRARGACRNRASTTLTIRAFYFKNTAGAVSVSPRGGRDGTAASATTAFGSPLRGLAFSSRPEDLDPAEAAALMGHAGDAVIERKLRAVFQSSEGCVVGAFASRARPDGGSGGAGEAMKPGVGRGKGGVDALRGIVAMGFGDLLAGDGEVDGKDLVGFAQAATDGAMVATVDVVVVGEDPSQFSPKVFGLFCFFLFPVRKRKMKSKICQSPSSFPPARSLLVFPSAQYTWRVVSVHLDKNECVASARQPTTIPTPRFPRVYSVPV